MADVWANSMSCQSHLPHSRVPPLGEFTVMIPEPHATFQGAATWRIYCYDPSQSINQKRIRVTKVPRATCHVPHCRVAKSTSRSWHIYEFHPPYWKSFFAIFYFIFVFLMQFGLWRAAGFVSSVISYFGFALNQSVQLHSVLFFSAYPSTDRSDVAACYRQHYCDHRSLLL